MKVTTTVTLEIKGVTHELTQAEAKSLLVALKAALEPTSTSPFAQANDISKIYDQVRREGQPYRLADAIGHPLTQT